MDREKLAEWITHWEGSRNEVYEDNSAAQHPTVGIGFNLDKPDAKEQIEGLGLNYEDVRDGHVALNQEQINQLFQHDVDTAISAAHHFVNNFDELPADKQMVLTDMAFNLGGEKLDGFVNLKEAIESGDWEKAATEMRDSHWYGQVGDGDDQRGGANVNVMMHGFSDTDQPQPPEHHSFNQLEADPITTEGYVHDVVEQAAHDGPMQDIHSGLYAEDMNLVAPDDHSHLVQYDQAVLFNEDAPMVLAETEPDHSAQGYSEAYSTQPETHLPEEASVVTAEVAPDHAPETYNNGDAVQNYDAYLPGSIIDEANNYGLQQDAYLHEDNQTYNTHSQGLIVDTDPGILAYENNDQFGDHHNSISLAEGDIATADNWATPIVEYGAHTPDISYTEPAPDAQLHNFEVASVDPAPDTSYAEPTPDVQLHNFEVASIEPAPTEDNHQSDWGAWQSDVQTHDSAPSFTPENHSSYSDTHSYDAGYSSDSHDSGSSDNSGSSGTSDNA